MAEGEARGAVSPEIHTWLSLERTLMAWIRTSAAFVGLGFTVTKLFDFLHDLQAKARPTHVLGYRTYSLVLVAMGVLGLVAAVVQHRRLIRRWWPPESTPPFSLATAAAVTFAIVGAAAFGIKLSAY